MTKDCLHSDSKEQNYLNIHAAFMILLIHCFYWRFNYTYIWRSQLMNAWQFSNCTSSYCSAPNSNYATRHTSQIFLNNHPWLVCKIHDMLWRFTGNYALVLNYAMLITNSTHYLIPIFKFKRSKHTFLIQRLYCTLEYSYMHRLLKNLLNNVHHNKCITK